MPGPWLGVVGGAPAVLGDWTVVDDWTGCGAVAVGSEPCEPCEWVVPLPLPLVVPLPLAVSLPAGEGEAVLTARAG